MTNLRRRAGIPAATGIPAGAGIPARRREPGGPEHENVTGRRYNAGVRPDRTPTATGIPRRAAASSQFTRAATPGDHRCQDSLRLHPTDHNRPAGHGAKPVARTARARPPPGCHAPAARSGRDPALPGPRYRAALRRRGAGRARVRARPGGRARRSDRAWPAAGPRRSAPRPDARLGCGHSAAPAPPGTRPAPRQRPAASPQAAPAGHVTGDWPSKFAQVLAETLAGSRPPAQLAPWTTERARSHIRKLGPLLSAGQRPLVQRVITSAPSAGVWRCRWWWASGRGCGRSPSGWSGRRPRPATAGHPARQATMALHRGGGRLDTPGPASG